MSLVQGVVYKDFILVSNDSKVIATHYDPKTLKKNQDSTVEIDLKSEKVHRIANEVFLSITGWSICCDLLLKEMIKRVDPYNDLSECYEVAKKLISDLKNWRVKGLTKEEQEAVILLDSETFSSYLFGFFHSGTTGIADIRRGKLTRTSYEEGKGYPVVFNGPFAEKILDEVKHVLHLEEKHRTIDNFVERMLYIHAYMSEKSVTVSPDCNFHLLQMDRGLVSYKTSTIDTIPLYQKFGLNPEPR